MKRVVEAHLVKILASYTEAEGYHSVQFEKPAGFSYTAGQYVQLMLDPRGGMEESNFHVFTLASSPTEPHLMITSLDSGSAFKQKFLALKAGDNVQIKGPYGRFVLAKGNGPHVFIAGGIGVTPFRSMLKDEADKKSGKRLVLLYSSRSPKRIAFKEELDAWAAAGENITVVHTVSGEEGVSKDWRGEVGRIDAAFLRKHSDVNVSTYYICGPPKMVEALEKVCKEELGVPAERVKKESFTGY